METLIKQKGLKIGFDKIAIAKAVSYPEHEALKDWLGQGFHGTMGYMERGEAKRRNPLEVMPEAKSVITCALNYNSAHPYSIECKDPRRGWIARYAWGEDYHLVMGGMLEKLVMEIRKRRGEAVRAEGSSVGRGEPEVPPSEKWYIDTGPVMERVFAKNSGIGWIGKNTCVIDPKLGSFIFLGVILTNLGLKPDPIVEDHCGKCTACIEACPTQAITAPHTLDARKCISYLTIEHRGLVAPELQEKIGNHLFGCDICQDVCPWNKKSPRTDRAEFQPREGFFNPDLQAFQKKVEENYPADFKHSPLKRAKKEGLLRNINRALQLPSANRDKGR